MNFEACRQTLAVPLQKCPRVTQRRISLQQIQDAARGQLSLDGLTRQLIRQSLCYRFTPLVGDAIAARAVEREIQREGLASRPPLLNPLPRSSVPLRPQREP